MSSPLLKSFFLPISAFLFYSDVIPILLFLLFFYLVLTGVVSEFILFLEPLILVIIVLSLFYMNSLDLVHLLSCALISPHPLFLPSHT